MKTFALALAMLATPCFGLEFEADDRILLYGNSFIERLQEKGEFEASIQLAHPGKKLQLRSLAWTGDELGYRLRPERYVKHLKNLLAEWPADVVIIGGFGWFEAFAGEAGLPIFRQNLETYLRELERRHPAAKIVLLVPGGPPFITSAMNRAGAPKAFESYRKAMDLIGKMSGAEVIDLAQGDAAAQLLGDAATDAERVEEVAKAVRQKHGYNATLVRPINTVVYFGVRGRDSEYAAEIPRYHQLVVQSDAVIHALASDKTRKFSDFPAPSLPPMGLAKKSGGEKEGLLLSPAEQQKTLKVADGYRLNLFASEERFPDMKNPLQIAFGPRGRLWVVTMPSFPHTVPGEQPKDKILILEDTDRDGVADKQTVFADGLNVPDGIVHYRDGVIVSAQPQLLYLWDGDGDGRADQRREILRGVDVTDAHHGGMIAMDPMGHIMFCDGVFHRSQFETPFGIVRGVDATTYRLNPVTGRIDPEYQTLTPNPWKITFDRWGNLFQMYGDGFVQDSQTIPWTPLGIYHPFKRSISVAYGKGSGAAVISSPNYPDAYQQGMASATLLGRGFVAMSKLDPHTGFHRASERIDLVSSDNLAFRPVDMAFGFDGAMYISDFCSAIVGHAQHPMRDPRWDHDHGRIWRVVHKGKPAIKDWPDVAAADAKGLLKLLAYPQDNVRDLARVRLRGIDGVERLLDAHRRANPKLTDEQKLELLWLYEGAGAERPDLLMQLLESKDFRIRAAAVRMIRHWADRIESPTSILARFAKDEHPRVRVEVINAVSHLQREDPQWAAILGQVEIGGYKPLETMLSDASHGIAPAKGPEVPVLDIPKDTRLLRWLVKDGSYVDVGKGKPPGKETLHRTYLRSATAQPAVLSLVHKEVRVSVNGVQLIDANTWWSSDWNLQVELVEGINEIEVAFGGGSRAQGVVPVYLFDPLGKPLEGVDRAADEAALRKFADARRAARGEGLHLSAVRGQLAFAPTELRAKPGEKTKLVFNNPDVNIHNVVLVKAGTAERVGLLADQLLTSPFASERQFVPDSEDVLWNSPLVNSGDKVALDFTAPDKPGRYPILCTFPGHWRVMRATLVVE